MNKKFLAISLVIGFIVFIAIAIITNLFNSSDLPIQITGALLEAVVTALITYFLLTGQTSQEEVKERNVKVFEKKSEVFNDFIEQLWTVWEDRSISLEELNRLIKIVAKNIIPYAKPETSKTILRELNKIADQINFGKSDNADETTTKQIQSSVFSIINAIANEIGLGGKIDECVKKELVVLENRVLPVLNKNNFVKQISELISEKTKGKLSNFQFLDSVLWWQIDKTNIWLAVGLKGKVPYITFWSTNRKIEKYKCEQKKFKEWLLGSEEFGLIDLQKINNGALISNDLIQQLCDLIIKFYEENEVVEGKTIRQIIEECVE